LSVHSGKSRVYRVEDGITFLGWRLFPDRMLLARRNAVRARRRLRKYAARYHAGGMTFEEVRSAIAAWLGHAGHGDTWRLRAEVLEHCTLVAAVRRRNCAAGRLLEQQSTERPRVEP
jgi:hypothetical protein